MGGLCFKQKETEIISESSVYTITDQTEETVSVTPKIGDTSLKSPPPRSRSVTRRKPRRVFNNSFWHLKPKAWRRRHFPKKITTAPSDFASASDDEKNEQMKCVAMKIFDSIKNIDKAEEKANKNVENEEYEDIEVLPQIRHFYNSRKKSINNDRLLRPKPDKTVQEKINSPQNIDFFTLLDSEIVSEVMNSIKIIQESASACRFIQLHLQSLCRDIFNGIFCTTNSKKSKI